nr:radical SAM protein [Candidatus Shapirobacteria bacterium]
MIRKILFAIRNRFESSKGMNQVLDWATNNPIYRHFTYKIFEKKVNEIKKTKKYLFAIEVSSFCNARCFFCPNSFMKRRKTNLGMEMFLKLVERIKEEGITPRSFNLTGTGEPLLDKTLLDKVEILKTNFPESEVFFPSNLALASEETLEKIVASKLDHISISLNASNAADYKRIMKLDYKKTIKNVNLLIRLRNKKNPNLKISLSVAANPINKKSIDIFIKKWQGKVDNIAINWINTWAGAIKNGEVKR